MTVVVEVVVEVVEVEEVEVVEVVVVEVVVVVDPHGSQGPEREQGSSQHSPETG